MLKISTIISLLGVLFFATGTQQAAYFGKMESTVVLVNTVFRHGDRTPDTVNNETFPTDPYQNSTFYPHGIGQLTNSGKRRAYQLGVLFRQRYNQLLGPVYWQPLLTARSTSVIRSKMTLKLVLAGMYPPDKVQRWNPTLNWQPANIINLPLSQDGLLLPLFCSSYIEAMESIRNDTELINKAAKFRDLEMFLTNKTGKEIDEIMDLYILYHSFLARSLMGLPLPDWIIPFFPLGELRDATVLHYQMSSYNPTLTRRNGGILLRRMIINMQEKINGTARDRRIHLYCGQELTVAAMLNALGIYTDQVPAYCSSVIVELHKIRGLYYVKVLYNHGTPQRLEEMKIPGCDVLCPFDRFVALRSHVIPTGIELQCDYPEPPEL